MRPAGVPRSRAITTPSGRAAASSAWQIATASASASCEVRRLVRARGSSCTIRCTWPLSARPWPQIDCLTRDGAYSVHSTPAVAAATSAAPRACPTESAMRASAPTNDSSSATASGACSSMRPGTPSKIVSSRTSGRSRAAGAPAPDVDLPDAPVERLDDPVAARSRPWVDAENLHGEEGTQASGRLPCGGGRRRPARAGRARAPLGHRDRRPQRDAARVGARRPRLRARQRRARRPARGRVRRRRPDRRRRGDDRSAQGMRR